MDQAGETEEVPVSTLEPPEGKDYLDNAILLYVKENHVLSCGDAPLKTAAEYMRKIFRSNDMDDAESFDLVNMADASVVNMIREHGVKSVALNAGLYQSAVEYAEDSTSQRKVIYHRLAQNFLDYFSNDEELKEYTEQENLTVQLILSFDRRSKGGKIGQERIKKIAEKTYSDDSDEGFKITTFNNEVISSDSIKLRKKVKMAKLGKTIPYEDGWLELAKYLEELTNSGALSS